MKKLLCAATLLGAASVWTGHLGAHGGTYRGPGDTVPPGGGGGTSGGLPVTPGQPGPTTGGVSGGPGTPPGETPGPQPGTGPDGGSTTGVGVDAVDLTGWSFWWEFNKDPYLGLRRKLREGGSRTGTSDFFLGQGEQDQAYAALAPSPAQVTDIIVPALLRALENERSNDIVTGCLIALAKIGDDRLPEAGRSEIADKLDDFLSDANQEIRETAAIALGILGDARTERVLDALLMDAADGRELVGGGEVDLRTRAFAAYGLALLANRSDDPDLRRRTVERLAGLLPDAERLSKPDVSVACLVGLGIVPIDAAVAAEGDAGPGSSRSAQVEHLLGFFEDGGNNRLLRAHVPTAVAKLLAAEPALPAEVRGPLKERVVAALAAPLDPRAAVPVELRQSCAYALGLVADLDEDAADELARERLMAAAEKDADKQVRKFSSIALGKIGARPGTGESPTAGEKDVRKHLLRLLSKGTAGYDRWAALGLGVTAYELRTTGLPELAVEARAAVRDQLAGAKNPDDKGAFAIAAGLLGDSAAAETLLEQLEATSQPEARGYVALALGLLGERKAQDRIRQIVRESEYQPDLLKQAAIALGLLGDKDLTGELVAMLEASNTLATQAAVASALGFIGDRESVDPLVGMLENERLTDSARGFAAVALGLVAEQALLPWNSKLSVDLNYRATTSTLNSLDGTGVLNIL